MRGGIQYIAQYQCDHGDGNLCYFPNTAKPKAVEATKIMQPSVTHSGVGKSTPCCANKSCTECPNILAVTAIQPNRLIAIKILMATAPRSQKHISQFRR